MMDSNGHDPFPGADAFLKMWTTFGSSMADAALTLTSAPSTPEAGSRMRSAMLEAWSDYCDKFMRSGEFREMMRQSLAAAVQGRKEMNDFFGRMQHELQGASRQDVDQIMLSLRHLERRIVDGMDRLSEQLEALSESVEKLGQRKSGKSARKTDRDA